MHPHQFVKDPMADIANPDLEEHITRLALANDPALARVEREAVQIHVPRIDFLEGQALSVIFKGGGVLPLHQSSRPWWLI